MRSGADLPPFLPIDWADESYLLPLNPQKTLSKGHGAILATLLFCNRRGSTNVTDVSPRQESRCVSFALDHCRK